MALHLQLGSIALALLLGACATTPQSRIERDPAGFAALSPEQQQKVQSGTVGVGFDQAAVRFAMGEPDRVVAREAAEGSSEVWVYFGIVPGAGFNNYCTPNYPFYGPSYFCRPISTIQYEERTRIAFQDGKVITVERVQ